jgi:predicted nucleotidyltransferase
MKFPTSEEVIKRAKLHPSRVKAIYVFGSRVYGTSDYASDWDFRVIANTSNTNQEIKSGDFNIHIQTPDQFQKLLDDHHPGALECYFAPDEFKILDDYEFDFKLVIPRLRHNFSHTSSNSWVKCKKKLEQDDYYVGIKSLFHSLRIPIFGQQIAKTGTIYDFSCANDIWYKIKSKNNWTWEELDSEFRVLRNNIMSDFRNCTVK